VTGHLSRIPFLAAVIWLAGCGSSPPIHFYTLSAEASLDPVAPVKDDRSISVGPVTLPEVIERPQFVLRTSPNRVTLVEEHRWAEPLQSEIPRILAENLSRLLGTKQVAVYPQSAGDHAESRVAVDVQRFESTLGSRVSIDVLWTIRQGSGSEALFKTGRSSLEEPVADPSYEALAAALSRGLVRVSRDIADAIRSLHP
jgi:uncharacterized lipoprotein YmbA